MTLTPGTRVGPYEITGSLGAGGMGEVYRAHDTKLGRDVAIKILPRIFTSDPDRLARFEREARLLASLNHPHIGAIYGLEAIDGTPALILELVEGDTLADRIAKGKALKVEGSGLPIPEALAIARQIADALEAAHDRGIVHRDLKPANIKITPTGVVKVLDFGLAKPGAGGAGQAGEAGTELTHSPTITIGGTRDGVILGTAAYMSPEQARGQVVDKRTDIWAFGCVLYEMLTGRLAFDGATVSDAIAVILQRDPDWRALPASTPVAVCRVLRRCLEKDATRRLHDIADARIDLDASDEQSSASARRMVAPRRAERIAWAGAVALIAALALFRGGYLSPASVDTHAYRTSILLPPGVDTADVGPVPAGRFALSPDGRLLAFVARGADNRELLWVRPLNALTSQPLAGTDGAAYPFWSPDSRSIAFAAQARLKRIEASGGPVLTVTDAMADAPGTWNRDNVILFTAAAPSLALRRVSASGGASAPVTTPDVGIGQSRHIYPFFLPDGRHFLYFAVGSKAGGRVAPGGIYVGSLDAAEKSKRLIEEGSVAKYAQGALLFTRDGFLMAQPFDVERLELTGQAAPLGDQVNTRATTGRIGAFSLSETGVLAYLNPPSIDAGRLVWFDGAGARAGTVGNPGDYSDLELSSDGRRAVVRRPDVETGVSNLWVIDIARGLPTRFTFEASQENSAIWSPDGSRIVFRSQRREHSDLYQKLSSGAGTEDVLLADNTAKFPESWSPDGRFILYRIGNGTSATGTDDLWILPLGGDRKPFPFLQTRFSEGQGRFSPDGRWIAYASDESGQYEVYVASFPGPGGKRQVSTTGGYPRWRRDGKELFYIAPGNKLMAAAVNGQGSSFEIGAVRTMFDVRPGGAGYFYDVAPDGRHFLVNTAVGEQTAAPPITLIVNWPALLKK